MRQNAQQLRSDLDAAHKALKDIAEILSNLHSDNPDLWYEIGRATGTAKMGLTGSGYREAVRS